MENEATLTTTTNTNNVNQPRKSKKKATLNIIRVALYMIRRRPNRKNDSANVEVASKGLWKRVVAAMRPLHHHHHIPISQKPPSAIEVNHEIIGKDFGYVDSYQNKSPNYLASPASSSSSSSSSSSATPSHYASALNLQELDKNDYPSSRYASALNLQELDKNGECENTEIVIENGDSDDEGDDMIDEKAEEFIAKFYEQMRLQRMHPANGYK